MLFKRSRTTWTTGLLALATAAGLTSASPAGALSGDEVKDGDYAFTARLNVGDQQACSGALVSAQWVLTAASCFAVDGKPVQAGAPEVKTTVTVGRSDLTQATGSVREAVELVPYADRDLVMVKLSNRIQNVMPVKIATSAPVAGEQLRSAGFGRTKTEWVPNKLHSSVFTVGWVGGKSVDLNGSADAVICQGDAGAPALRTTQNGGVELVAVNSRSWQGGCLGTDAAETRTSAVDVRVDDLGGWIQKTAFRVQDDFTGDGIADLAAIWSNGTMHIYPGDKAKGLAGTDTQQLGAATWKTTKKLAKGDFTNDGVADLMAIRSDGTMYLYKGDGKGNITDGVRVAAGGNTWGTTKQLTAGDFTGDGIADLMAIWDNGTMHLYKGKGNGQIEEETPVTVGGNTWATVRLLPGGDFNGDGIADIMAVWNDGTMHYYRGNGDGQIDFERPVAMGGNTWKTVPHMTGGDFDGDGIADIMAVWVDGTMHLYKGKGDGGLTDGTTMWGGNTWKTTLKLV
ncbi:FG-GAP-like repeat-containing protein [Streptomyces violascens]|uniref:FG-GAP-like repeat-containing protein n=1 Tax=Streptomyces violascens TaxID=67381 RepID=UPI003691BDF0